MFENINCALFRILGFSVYNLLRFHGYCPRRHYFYATSNNLNTVSIQLSSSSKHLVAGRLWKALPADINLVSTLKYVNLG